MVRNLRPRQAAEALGIGLSTFWLRAKTDPDFPLLVRLGPKSTVVRETDLEAYVEKKASEAREAAEAVSAPPAPKRQRPALARRR